MEGASPAASADAEQASESAQALREILLAILSLETAASVYSERIAHVLLDSRALEEAASKGSEVVWEAGKLLGTLQAVLFRLRVRDCRGLREDGEGDIIAGSPMDAGKMCSVCRVVVGPSCFSKKQWVTR